MVESPCVKVCRTKDEVCTGCGRTICEVIQWKKLTPLEQWIINDKAKERMRVR